MAAMDKALHRAASLAAAYLDALNDAPVGAKADTDTLRNNFGGKLPETGTEPYLVVEELYAAAADGLAQCAGPRFFAWVNGGTLEAALAADWLVSAWDQNAAIPAHSLAAAAVEEAAGAWLKDLLGLPADASFAFTTGCQMAHFTCLSAARYAVLKRVGWDVNQQGLFGAPPVTVVVNAMRHTTVDRALRYLGFGSQAILTAPVNGDDQITPDQFRTLLDKIGGPSIVVLNAGDLNIGTYDQFSTIIPIAREYGAWVHVDGAFGLIARASRSKAPMLEGVDLADSWATDGHKWLNIPYDSGFAFVRDAKSHRNSMSVDASYVADAIPLRKQMDWNPEFSRRARGFPVYAALRQLGRRGVEELIDRNCAMAQRLVAGIGQLPGAEVLRYPTLNQGLLRFPSPSPGAVESDHDRRTAAVIEAINATGEAFFSGSVWRGMRVMRVSVVNWRTAEDDVDRTIAAVKEVLLSMDSRETEPSPFS